MNVQVEDNGKAEDKFGVLVVGADVENEVIEVSGLSLQSNGDVYPIGVLL